MYNVRGRRSEMELRGLRTLNQRNQRHPDQDSPLEKEKVGRRRSFLGEPPGGATTTKPLQGWSSGGLGWKSKSLFHATLMTPLLMPYY